MTVTLGIHDGHTATASIIRDGKIVAAISEERLNRIKEYGGFPEFAVKEVMKLAEVSPDDIDGVAVVGILKPTTPEGFYKPDWWKRIFGIGANFVPKSFLRTDAWVNPALYFLKFARGKGKIIEKLKGLGINIEPNFYEHHLTHAAVAHYTAWHGCDENLVLTCDGSGDAICATVNIGRGQELERIATISNYNSIGEFYTRVTQYQGMKPMSHEYKVMGLAPYAKERYAKETYGVIKDFFKFSKSNPLVFENHSSAWKWGYIKKFQEIFTPGHRFDNIARATQSLVENVLVQWIKNSIKKTGIGNLVLSGGVFMNVKVNLKIIEEIPEIENIFIFPSGGDESLAMGAAMLEYIRLEGNSKIDPLGPIYFGQEFSKSRTNKAIEKYGANKKFHVEEIPDIDKFVGEELVRGKIIARYSGRMEWGARALGNRSILADPRKPDIVRRINEAIKGRDFWMPFAPSIIKEREKDYIVNSKSIKAPYMTIAFNTTTKGKRDLKSALHPYDFTARPQVIEKDWNPRYHNLIKIFESKTGIGGVLNTSFNLHGKPIVCSPTDALRTFENSDLDALAIDDYFISKKL